MADAVSKSFPLLLPGDGKVRSAYGPTNDLGSFVGHLLAKGINAATVPREFRGIAALEAYIGSVDGGGHEGLWGNNEEESYGIVQEALVGCEILGLDLHAAIASEFLEAMAVDGDGKNAFERGEGQVVRPKLQALDARMYDVRISDAEAIEAAARVPARYREEVANVLTKRDMYSRNPFTVEGMVWVLNHPKLKWHSGPDYWDAVANLAATKGTA